MKIVPTYTATVYVGFREKYTGEVRSVEMARQLLTEAAKDGGLCVALTPTEFIYKDGSEPGAAIGLINYPRFPETVAQIREKALSLAQLLMNVYKQMKVSVVFPDETVMITQETVPDDQKL